MNGKYKMVVYADGRVLFRRKFRGGWIAMQRLQFSSGRGVAFAVSSQRTPQMIEYYETSESRRKGKDES